MQAFILKTPTTFLLMTAVTPTFGLHDDSHSYIKGNKKAVTQRMGWVARAGCLSLKCLKKHLHPKSMSPGTLNLLGAS